MSRVLDLIAGGLRLVTLGLLVLLVGAMAVQVAGRYLLLRGVPFTDEIAMISLTWMVYLAVPWVYRLDQHIVVHLPLIDPRSRVGRACEVGVHGLVAALMVLVLRVGWDMAPMTSRIVPGTLPVSRFEMHFLPLMTGAALTILFAVEAIARTLRRPAEAL